MDSNDFELIESQLGVVLPNVFRELMRQFPNDPGNVIHTEYASIPANAELFVISQLQAFRNDAGPDYYELQPELRDHRFMDIGGDGCGNFYCMVGNNAGSNELWMWEHDPHNGLVRCGDTSLMKYFGVDWQLTTGPNPFVSAKRNGTVITRADHPERSILAPIALQEWLEYAASRDDLELDENRELTFGKQTIIARTWPGRVKLKLGDATAHLVYQFGRLSLKPPRRSEVSHAILMQRIAEDLKANLY